MVTPLESKSKLELDNLRVQYTWPPKELLVNDTYCQLNDIVTKAYKSEERHLEWRKAIYKTSNVEFEVNLH